MQPLFHDSITWKPNIGDQGAPCLVEPHGRDQNMKMGVEIQMSSEGVRDHQSPDARAVLLLSPVL